MAKLISNSELIKLRGAGMSSRQIARQLNVSHTTICNRLRDPRALVTPIQPQLQFDFKAEYEKLLCHLSEAYQREQKKLGEAKQVGNTKAELEALKNISKIYKLQRKFEKCF